MSIPEEHPAIHRIRAALENKQHFTSGTCPVNLESLNLYYRLSDTDKFVVSFRGSRSTVLMKL